MNHIRFYVTLFLLSGCVAYNLGTGCGRSVLEMVAAFEKASGKVIYLAPRLSNLIALLCLRRQELYLLNLTYMIQKIPLKLCPRRPGDATAVYASTEKAEKELGWK